ncbi:MAG: hypothetical protein MI919_41885 [Holophagales bacterium]|nr:hypothetical protein [Holophagales bacterium]
MAVLDLLPTELTRQLRTGRDLASERRRTPDDVRLSTACPAFDAVLGGGLERGTCAELVGWGSSGRFSLVLGALAAVTARGEAAALVDLGDGLDPCRAAEAGVVLERLLWVRPRNVKQALASAEILLELGLPLLALDLGVPPVPGGRGVEAFWLRLARGARKHRTALLVSSPYRVSGTAAQVVVEARDRRGMWQGRGRQPRLLGGATSRLYPTKGPGWTSQEPRPLELAIAPPPPPPPAPEKEDEKGGPKAEMATGVSGTTTGPEAVTGPRAVLRTKPGKARYGETGPDETGRSKAGEPAPPPDPLLGPWKAIAPAPSREPHPMSPIP